MSRWKIIICFINVQGMRKIFLGVFEKLRQCLSEEDLQRFVFAARQIWFRRNSVVFGVDLLSPTQINQAATIQMKNFQQVECARRKDSSPLAIHAVEIINVQEYMSGRMSGRRERAEANRRITLY
jgi:hypothetical protein